ncbi:hypothetical protein B9Q04_13645 [Candidatus Marsarchaeota G2 archaeon BE_D]|uniref:ArnR1-like winged helix-turn-helix domain-containing protein n=1 Tax=Candidatus Marsarchaeota G2 archaeon BE_D TaxID=1978158 RepID=A0A2R6C7U2_9ARCH|nr:MAG: hypothetical protein B9Q04_13645 [Candidatus Marsarchaeota G2 archaeon BE_D]
MRQFYTVWRRSRKADQTLRRLLTRGFLTRTPGDGGRYTLTEKGRTALTVARESLGLKPGAGFLPLSL